MTDVEKALTPTVLHILLRLTDGPQHGYALMQGLEEEVGIKAGPGTVYGVIGDLEDVGWLERLPAEDRRKRFQLTPSGWDALRRESQRLIDLTRRLADKGLADPA